MDPGTRKILWGDENQRFQDMGVRRIVTLSEELTQADVWMFNARLALKEFLNERSLRSSSDINAVKLATEMSKLNDHEQSMFKTNHLSTVHRDKKQIIRQWEHNVQPKRND